MSEYYQIEERIQNILSQISPDVKPNISALAREHGVPYKRLRSRIQGGKSRITRPPTNKRLDSAQEFAILEHIKRMDEIGIKTRIKSLPNIANGVLARNFEGAGDPPKVGHCWASRFLKRHPEIKKKKQKPMEPDRLTAHNPETIRKWFRLFSSYIHDNGIQPDDLWNFDETGIRIGIGKNQEILTFETSKRRLWMPSALNRESATVVEAVSAAGAVIDPMVILRGSSETAHHQQRWFQDNTWNRNYLICFTESAYINDEKSLYWIKHFDRLSRKTQKGAQRVLLFDGHESHNTGEFLEYCEAHDIQAISFPSHLTHLIQPLDIGIFQPWKHWHGQAVDEAARTGCMDFNRTEFLHALHKIRTQTIKPKTIQHAFKKSGIWPIDAEVILSKLDESELEPEPAARPATPPPPEINFSNPPTPYTIRTTRRYFQAVKESTDEIRNFRLNCALDRGMLHQLESGWEAIEQLRQTEAAQAVRRARQQQSRKIITKGGFLYSSHARWIKNKDSYAQLQKKKLSQDVKLAKIEESARRQYKRVCAEIRKFAKGGQLRNHELSYLLLR